MITFIIFEVIKSNEWVIFSSFLLYYNDFIKDKTNFIFTFFDEGYYNSYTNISIVYDIFKFQ